MELIEHAILITIATAALIMTLAFRTGQARQKAGEAAYGEAQHDEGVRIANRIHLNTIEMAIAFLPMLWITALYASEMAALVGGWTWVGARIGYAISYTKKPSSRAPFFVLNLLCIVGLMAVTIYHLFT